MTRPQKSSSIPFYFREICSFVGLTLYSNLSTSCQELFSGDDYNGSTTGS
jgi:hypothetical protein